MSNPKTPPPTAGQIPERLKALGFIDVAEARARFGELCYRVSAQHEQFAITEHGKGVAVLVSPGELADLERWAVTAYNLCYPGKASSHQEAVAELRAGAVPVQTQAHQPTPSTSAATTEPPPELEVFDAIDTAEANARFGELCHQVVSQRERFIITENGERAAVLLHPHEMADLEDWAAIGYNKTHPGEYEDFDEVYAELHTRAVS